MSKHAAPAEQKPIEDTVVLPVGTWLVDVTPGQGGKPTLLMFKVVSVGKDTVDFVDEHGNRRTTSKITFVEDVEAGNLVDAKKHLRDQYTKKAGILAGKSTTKESKR